LFLLGVPSAAIAANLADFAGVYEGTFSGDGQVSQWSISIDEKGIIDGTFSSNGEQAVRADGQFSVVGPSGATFSGYISPQGDITGTWDRGRKRLRHRCDARPGPPPHRRKADAGLADTHPA
jgi:hypothetical protein